MWRYLAAGTPLAIQALDQTWAEAIWLCRIPSLPETGILLGTDLQFQELRLGDENIANIIYSIDDERPIAEIFQQQQSISGCFEDSPLQGYPADDEIEEAIEQAISWVSA